MSSRLLTMKFMQRGAASPSSSAASSPSTPAEPPSKRQRLSTGSYVSTPRSEAQAVAEALAEEERKRSEALDREAADRGDTKWYLSFEGSPVGERGEGLRVVSAGYSALDGVEDVRVREGEDNEKEMGASAAGRRSFGNFNKRAAKTQDPASTSASESDSDSEPPDLKYEDEDDPNNADALISQARREAAENARAERKAQRKADKADALRLAEMRRSKQVKLNGLTSISANGASAGGAGAGAKNVQCHSCGQLGHFKRDCPRNNSERSRGVRREGSPAGRARR